MSRIQLNELNAFVAVAEHSSFTKGAAHIGIALPTISQTVRSLEERLGVRLFNRTTRSVSLTEAGARLLAEVQPLLDGLDHALELVNLFRDKPIGRLRIGVIRPFATLLLAPLIKPFLDEYADIRVEIAVTNAHTDIVKEQFDCGIRVGNRVERDMTVFKLSSEFRVLAVASPGYLKTRPVPQQPRDLHAHNCIKYRLPWDGSMASWLFAQGDRNVEVAVDGSLIVDDIDVLLRTTLDGVGVAYLPDVLVAPYLAEGSLVDLLPEWSSSRNGVYLYHPTRRQTPMPLQVFLKFVEERLRYERRARP